MLKKSPFFTCEQGYVIIIIGNYVSLYFKRHLEKLNMIMMKYINACLSQTLKPE